MDVAALGMKIDSSDVVKATTDLDKFAASADRAAGSAGKLSSGGNTAKLATDYARAARAADQAGGAVAKASQMVSAANAHVVTYRNHLQGIVTASGQAAAAQNTMATAVTRTSAATQQADSHIIAYRNNLERQVAASKAAGAASGAAATQVEAVGKASRATSTLVSGLAGILGGLVGVILGSVVSAIVEFVAGLFEADKALEAVTVASDNLGAAQSVLGQMFDLSTGKIKNNTEAIRSNIYMQMKAFEGQQITARQEARKAVDDAGLGGTTALGRFGTRLLGYATRDPTTEARIAAQSGNSQVGKLVKAVAAGMPIDRAGAELDRAKMGDKDYFAAINALNKAYESFTAGQAARQLGGVLDGGGLPAQFLRPESGSRSTRGGRGRGAGGKTDAEKLADLIRNAEAEITVEKNRSKAVELSAEAAAQLEQKTKLLNAASSAGLKITPELTTKLEKLADAYAQAKIDADMAEVVETATDEIRKQRDAIADSARLIGLRGDALARETREIEAQKKLRDSLPKGSIYVGGNLTSGLSDDIEADARDRRIAKMRQDAEDTAYAMDLERAGLELTGQAALEYAYIVEHLNKAKREGIALSATELSAIYDAADAYAAQRYALDQQAQSLANNREIARGFFTDYIDGLRQSGDATKAFADAAVNALNRVIEKLLDRALNGFLDSLFPSSGAKLQAASLSTIAANPSIFAKGGAFGTAERFANGGAFTNQIVNNPTLFKFANGSKFGLMGEAGPEAVMPLTRGPNGKLGVQAHGAGRGEPPSVAVSIQQDFHLTGTVSQKDVESMSRQAAQQGAEAAVNTVRRNFDTYLREWDNDGAVTS